MKQEALRQIFAFEDHHWWYRARRAIVKKALDAGLSGKKNAILEVGCGSGGNLELLSSYGSVWAVEQHEEARRRATDRGIGIVEAGSLPENLPFDRSFDLICLLDVLEHVAEDEKSLFALKTLMADGGRLLITVPAYAFLWSHHDDWNEHKRRYTRRQLLNLLACVGLEPEYSTYFNTILFPAIAGIRLLKNLFRATEEPDFKHHSAITAKLLYGLMSSERHVMPYLSLPFGVSVLAVARKPVVSNEG